MALDQVSPQLDLWSDASDVGWGAHLGEEVTSGLWAPEELDLSINVRELLAIEKALHWFAPQIRNSSGGDFCGQRYGGGLSGESERNTFVATEFHRSEDLTVVGNSSRAVDSPIHLGSS